MSEMNVTFTEDIPKIEREGFTRGSKYTKVLDACVERPGKAARITVETQGQASSRASSIRDAASKHPAENGGRGLFTVATRSGDSDSEFHVYCKFDEAGSDDFNTEQTKRNKSDAKGSDSDESPSEGESTPARKPVKKATKKASA